MTRESMDENTLPENDRVEYVNCGQIPRPQPQAAPDVIVHQPTSAPPPSSNHADATKDPDNATTHDDDATMEKHQEPEDWDSSSTVYSADHEQEKSGGGDGGRGGGGGGGRGGGGRVWATEGGQYSVEGETKRDWTSDLFFSIRGHRHKKASTEDVKRACRDCACVPCMMCSVSRRLGDPRYLPFVPCTGPAVRFKVRIVRGITGSICDDCLVTSCCWPCAVCQMDREMDEM